MPDFAIFADTGSEPKPVMEHLQWLESGNVLPFPVRRVSAGSLTDSIETRAAGDKGRRFVAAPFFTSTGGMGRRQCTREFKVAPIEKLQRELLGYKPRQRIPAGSCEVWIGFSTDEVVRAGPAFKKWAVNRFPLLEQRMTRWDCEQWLRRHDYPVPMKSACVFCPYRSNHEWENLKCRDPEGFAEACRIDALVRDTPGMKAREFVHRELKPLGEVEFDKSDPGQGMLMLCEGACGT